MEINKYRFFLNRINNKEGFREALHTPFFVDKSLMIEEVNKRIGTKEKWLCVSRPRRFGKTMALEMLAAYYTKNVDSEDLFYNLNISKSHSYYKHLNAHNVILINFNDYFDDSNTVHEGILKLSERLICDLNAEYPEILGKTSELSLCLDMICQATGEKFIVLIDEWDCVFRVKKGKQREQEEFLNFLRALFKDKVYLELVYMTGILPVKKYNTGSALNMFREFTMLEPKKFASFFGFTENEIQALCSHGTEITMDELKDWYNGYNMPGVGDIYNPRSVVEALSENLCQDYWNRTGGFSELEEYITMNFDGLGEMVTRLIAGEAVPINVVGFANDLDSFHDKDEVFTALIHLGYLTYKSGTVRIPNRELMTEFADTIKKLSWGTVSYLLNQSRELLKATLSAESDKVAQILENVHDDMEEFKEYNNEHTLKCVIHLAYYAAVDEYDMKYEYPAGKGYADCIMIPKKKDLPGIVIELKYNKSAEQAIEQIKNRKYFSDLKKKVHQILLVGINYDKKTKKHQCMIEKISVYPE